MAPLLLAALLFSPPVKPPSVSADVVVTAEATAEPEATLGVAATVIDSSEIQRSQATSVLDLLRTVPGLDVVQSGSPGTVTSLFLRGTNSNQTLVLVDGVKLNSPYFGGVDLSTLSTVNVERIEIVRGPFSALYGSEAIGGVIQIFTKRGGKEGVEGRLTLAAGNRSAREGTAAVSVTEGAVKASAGFRRSTTDGDLPNDFFEATGLAGAVDVAVSPEVTAGVAVRRDTSRTGVPFVGATVSPRRSTTVDTTTVEVPVVFALGATSIEASFRSATDRPTLSDPDDPFFSRSDTDAARLGGRVTASRTLGIQRLAIGADWERTKVTNEDSFGVELPGLTTRTWSVFAEDRIALAGDRFVATVGIRRDEHSAFGGATNPRATFVFRPTTDLKLRAAVGTAFRSPTTGELYYPFSGNPDLKPEKSTSYEAGAEWTVAPKVVAETSFFWNDIRDLIVFDPVTFTNQSVGRARTRGAEMAIQSAISETTHARFSYTYLEATDRDTGDPLLRRPKHRASATLGRSYAAGGSWDLTALFVGRRTDRGAADFTRLVESPSYFRIDAAVTFPPFARVSPFVRATNLLGRDYSEVNGFPSPGRRWLLGLETSF